jgi:hypothetical protein
MPDLKTLRRLLVHNGVKVKSYDGAFIVTEKGDVWCLAHDVFYKNNVEITLKEIRQQYPKKLA